jgi:hypothetical protein
VEVHDWTKTGDPLSILHDLIAGNSQKTEIESRADVGRIDSISRVELRPSDAATYSVEHGRGVTG